MNGISAYKENAMMTQSPGRVVVLLYEGAIRFLRQAIEEIQAKQYAQKNERIQRAGRILDELNYALDMEVGGELAVNLRSLYVFMVRQLAKANMTNQTQTIQEVISILEDLAQGWKALAE